MPNDGSRSHMLRRQNWLFCCEPILTNVCIQDCTEAGLHMLGTWMEATRPHFVLIKKPFAPFGRLSRAHLTY